MKNFRDLEENAWQHFSNESNIGNAHYYEDGELNFNGKESIILFDAAQQGREDFKIVFQKMHYRFLYFESMR